MNGAEPAAPVVIAMLKAPRAGFVKTRLAREIGAGPAAAVYRRLVEHQVASIPRDWPVEIHFAPAEAEAEMRAWLGIGHVYHTQVGDDLGARLVHAIAGAFHRGASAVLVIGGDCPGLDEAALREAWSALQAVDVVLGPALDGGYYLIGLRRPLSELFRGIPWSTDTVFKVTMDRVREAGLSHALLSAREDVDDLASWRRLEALLPAVAASAARETSPPSTRWRSQLPGSPDSNA